MKRFYLLRHEDLHGHAGLGVVAEGCIFDNGMGSMYWLSDEPTLTFFIRGVRGIKKLHRHTDLLKKTDRTEIIIEGQDERFEWCQEQAKLKKDIEDHRLAEKAEKRRQNKRKKNEEEI